MTGHDEHDERDEAPLTGAAAEAAAAYQRASDIVPREAMWEAIQARRSRGVAPTAAPSGGATVVSLAAARATSAAPVARVPRWAYAAAATVLLTLGIGIGRQMTHTSLVPIGQVALVDTSGASAVAWQVASTEHFGQAETMLTWLSSTPEARSQAQLSAWSRDLLASTRLLLDSPAGRDPKRRALLQEMELLLVQLVESGPAMGPEDRTIMDELLSRSSLLLTRIRTAVPAGMSAAQD